jgi:regulator of sigma E protease
METLFLALHNALWFVIILSIIVFIHEFGHYYIAKISGVKIDVFAIGFGPEIFGWNDKSGTRWKVCYIPMGGYVKMHGDINPASMPDEEKMKEMSPEEKKVAFHYKSLPTKAAIVFAGPLANFLLAIAILIFFFSYYGKPIVTTEISDVTENSAAAEAGLVAGDVINAIDGSKVKEFADIQRVIALNTGTPVEVEYTHEGEARKASVMPKITVRTDIFGNEVKGALLGIRANVVSYNKLNAGSAAIEAVKETYNLSVGTLTAIWQMITGQRSAREISGPIGIAKYSGQSAEKGLPTVLWFMAIISINLGLVNLFPIPALDGGHLLYYAIEALRGEPMAEKFQQWGFRFGIAIVGTLAVFAIFNDIRNLNLF